MSQSIDIQGVGVVEFPDGMSDADINAAIEKEILPQVGKEMSASARANFKTGRRKESSGDAAPSKADHAAAEAQSYEMQANLARVGEVAARSVDVFGAVNQLGKVSRGAAVDLMSGNVLPRPGRVMPAMKNVGNVMAGQPTEEEQLSTFQKGLADAAQSVPTIAAGTALQSAGVPAALAFGMPMGGAAFEETKDPQAALLAGATGAALPGVAQVSRQLTGKVLSRYITAEAAAQSVGIQKVAESLVSNASMQAVMELSRLPEYVEAGPEQRKEMLVRGLAGNLAFGLMELPQFRKGVPSETQKALQALESDLRETVLPSVDLEAITALDPRNAQQSMDAPMPETAETLEAQIDLLIQGKKPAVLVTPGAAMADGQSPAKVVEANPNLAALEVDGVGTFVYDPARMPESEVIAAVENQAYGKILGMGQESKPVGGTDVLQTKNAEGTPVMDEVVTAETLPQARAAAEKVVPEGGSIEVKPAEEVLADRAAAADAAGTEGTTTRGASGTPFASVPSIPATVSVHVRPMEMPELVRFTRELSGDVPFLKAFAKARGMMYAKGKGQIGLHPRLFEPANHEQLLKTMAHELGHLVDYLPDPTLKRGNVLGRVLTLRNFLKESFGGVGVKNSELRTELIALSAFWRPWNRAAAKPSFIKYRDSAVELYADAISVLFNSPGLLQQRAPKFFAEFFQHLDQKPEVKKEFFRLQDLLERGPDAVAKERMDYAKQGFLKAEEVFKQKVTEREARRNSFDGFWMQFKQEFADRGEMITKSVAAAKERGATIPTWADPRNAWEQMLFADNQNLLDVKRIYDTTVKPIEDAGMTLEDLGLLLKFQREQAGRGNLANPGGMTLDTAADTLAQMSRNLGPVKMAVLDTAAKEFRSLVFERVTVGKDVGIYNAETYDTVIVPNKDSYAAFRGLDHVDTFVSPMVRRGKGTLGDIENPVLTTLLKLTSLNNLIAVQKAKIASREFFMKEFPDSFKLAEVVHTGKELRARPPKDGLERLEILEDGKLVAYDVDPYIADAFAKLTPAEVSTVTKLLNWPFQNVIYPLIIKYNPGFQLALNPYRDFKRSARNLGASAGVSRFQLIRNYAKSWKSAKSFVEGKFDPMLEEMLKESAIGTPLDSFNSLDRTDALNDILTRYKLSSTKERSGVVKGLMWLPDKVQYIGSIFEALPKVASYRTLVKDRGWLPSDASVVVRNYVGTPNFKVKGKFGSVANVLVPFSNIFVQGYRTDFKLATSPKTAGGWWFRWMLHDGSKAMIVGMASAGVFGAVMKELYDGISEYDKSNYTCIPIGYQMTGDFGKKTVYVRLPRDEASRFLSATAYKLTRLVSGDKEAREFPTEVFDVGAGIVPTTTPVLQMADAWRDYLRGQNPIDPWRNRAVVPSTEFKAGGWDSLKPMMTFTLQKAGASTFFHYNSEADTTTEAILSAATPLNRLLKISDYGYREGQMQAEANEDRTKAVQKLESGDDVRKLLHEYNYLQQFKGRRTEEQEERYALLSAWHIGFRKFDEAIWLLNSNGGDATKVKQLQDQFSRYSTEFEKKVRRKQVSDFRAVSEILAER
jgi:hypothetical protein